MINLKENQHAVDTSILLAGTGAGIYAMLCPSLFTAGSSFFHDNGEKSHNVKNMRIGYVAATAIVLTMGWAASRAEGSRLPMYAAITVGVVGIGGYEYMMGHGPDSAKPDEHVTDVSSSAVEVGGEFLSVL